MVYVAAEPADGIKATFITLVERSIPLGTASGFNLNALHVVETCSSQALLLNPNLGEKKGFFTVNVVGSGFVVAVAALFSNISLFLFVFAYNK
jgi:hypothetical protein